MTETALTKRVSAVDRLTATLAKAQGASLSALAQSVADERAGRFLLLDCSSSMGWRTRSGRTRFECLHDVVRELGSAVAGLRTIVFPDPGDPCGIASAAERPLSEYPTGGTPLAAALTLAQSLGARRVVVISDGEPTDGQEACLEAARRLGRVDVFFVGDPGGSGEAFMRQLAAVSGGQLVSDAAMLGGGSQRALVAKATLALTGRTGG